MHIVVTQSMGEPGNQPPDPTPPTFPDPTHPDAPEPELPPIDPEPGTSVPQAISRRNGAA